MKAFMGVSIRHPFYSKKENILKAIDLTRDFDEFLIFVVDYPYKLSLEAFKGLSEREAEQTTIREGKELKSFLTKVSKQFNNVKICSWENLISDDYKKILTKFKKMEKEDKKFSELIKGEFTGTIIEKIGSDQNKLKLSLEFIMEEMAMFVSLILRGYSTRISKYPRSKSVDYFLKKNNIKANHVQL